MEEVHTIEYDESEASPVQRQSTPEAITETKSTEYEVDVNLLEDPPTGDSGPLYDAYINLLDVALPISKKEDETIPDLSIWGLATLSGPSKDLDDDNTMKSDATK